MCAILAGKLNEIISQALNKKYFASVENRRTQQNTHYEKCSFCQWVNSWIAFLGKRSNLVYLRVETILFYHFTFSYMHKCTLLFSIHIHNKPYQLNVWHFGWIVETLKAYSRDFAVVSLYLYFDCCSVRFHSVCTIFFCLSYFSPRSEIHIVDHFSVGCVYTIYKYETPASVYVCICAYEHVSSPIRISK